MNKLGIDWNEVKLKYEAGSTVSQLAQEYNCHAVSVRKYCKRGNWVKPTVDRKKARAKQLIAETMDGQDKVIKQGGAKDVPHGRSIGQPLGEIGADRAALSKMDAALKDGLPEGLGNAPLVTGKDLPKEVGLSVEAQSAIELQARTEVALMRTHRRVINRAATVADNILTRLHSLVVDGIASDVITFQTKRGEAYHRVAFLGDRESVSDALLKCTNAISKLIPLERQAHGIADRNDDERDRMPQVTLNMPNIKVVSVNGRGQVIGSEEVPAPIEGKAKRVQ